MPYQSNHSTQVKPVEQVTGAFRRTLVDGEKMMIIEWTMDPGTAIPLHQHPHEQSGYVISGEMVFFTQGNEHRIRPGMGYLVTGNEPHGARFDVPTVIVDIFSPPRADYRGDVPSSYKVVTEPKAPARRPTAASGKARSGTAAKKPASRKPAAKKATTTTKARRER
jgi:quercetin dioxygenase-like cupin family protein